MPAGVGVSLSAAGLLGRWIAAQVPGALLVGPDEESGQWVSDAAAAGGLDHAIGRKVRHGDAQVQIAFPDVDVTGRPVVLLDDMASTGRTLIGAARDALVRGAVSVDVAVTHALFNGDALPALQAAGVRHVWSSNAVPHASNSVCVAALVANSLRRS
jgi:ribose-phosphate pyrophosphokinase